MHFVDFFRAAVYDQCLAGEVPAVIMRNRRHRSKNRFRYKGAYHEPRHDSAAHALPPEQPDSAPSASYLKSLVDSRAKVVVVLKTGERLSGRIRYYDRDCFSLGPTGGGPKLFLRKSSVSYIEESET